MVSKDPECSWESHRQYEPERSPQKLHDFCANLFRSFLIPKEYFSMAKGNLGKCAFVPSAAIEQIHV